MVGVKVTSDISKHFTSTFGHKWSLCGYFDAFLTISNGYIFIKPLFPAKIGHFRTLEAARGKTKETMVGIKVV